MQFISCEHCMTLKLQKSVNFKFTTSLYYMSRAIVTLDLTLDRFCLTASLPLGFDGGRGGLKGGNTLQA